MTAPNHIFLPIERLSKLEQRMDIFERQHDTMSKKVDEMHAVLMQARGAKWAMFVLWTAAGSAVATTGFILTHWNWR